MKRPPKMTKAEHLRYVRITVRMFQAGYSPDEIIKWTQGAESGFGHYWASKFHAGRALRYVRDAISSCARRLNTSRYHNAVPWRKLESVSSKANDHFIEAVAAVTKEKIDDLAQRRFDQP